MLLRKIRVFQIIIIIIIIIIILIVIIIIVIITIKIKIIIHFIHHLLKIYTMILHVLLKYEL